MGAAHDECRICLQCEPSHSLIRPCLCCGYLAHVHRECLQQWRESSARTAVYYSCQTCLYQYNLRRSSLSYGAEAISVAIAVFATVTCMAACAIVVGFVGGALEWSKLTFCLTVYGLLWILGMLALNFPRFDDDAILVYSTVLLIVASFMGVFAASLYSAGTLIGVVLVSAGLCLLTQLPLVGRFIQKACVAGVALPLAACACACLPLWVPIRCYLMSIKWARSGSEVRDIRDADPQRYAQIRDS